MQNKSARQIQNELEFMRRAYADRAARLESLNRYLSEPHPIARPAAILGSLAALCATIVVAVCFIRFILS